MTEVIFEPDKKLLKRIAKAKFDRNVESSVNSINFLFKELISTIGNFGAKVYK